MVTEKRLIDANNVEFALVAICDRESGVPLALAEWLAGAVRNAPTVDAVEVVRCKDCKHWLHLEDGRGDCTNGRFHIPGVADITMNAEEFCCLGERKDNGV